MNKKSQQLVHAIIALLMLLIMIMFFIDYMGGLR